MQRQFGSDITARVMASVTRYVEGKLSLKVNREKNAVDRPWNRKFPGFSFLTDKKATIRLAPKTLERFEERTDANGIPWLARQCDQHDEPGVFLVDRDFWRSDADGSNR